MKKDLVTSQQDRQTSWDRQATKYDSRNLRIYHQSYELSIQKALEHLLPDDSVLEIGCGTGIITLGIAPQIARIQAIDLSPQMLRIAEQKVITQNLQNCHFQLADGHSLPFEAESFDAVLLFNTLHAVSHPLNLLREIHRLIKPGGKLISATDCYAEPLPHLIALRMVLFRLLVRLKIMPYFSWFLKQDIHHLFTQSGFTAIEKAVLHAHPVNYFLVGQKNE